MMQGGVPPKPPVPRRRCLSSDGKGHAVIQTRRFLLMTTVAGLCAMPLIASGQAPGREGMPGSPPGAATEPMPQRGADRSGATTPGMAVDGARLQGGRRASRVIGSNIINEHNETIGEVEDLIVTQAGGQPVAVLSVGGFLGIGARLVAVPYERLQYNAESNRWVLPGATRDSLRSLPEFTYPEERRRG